MLQAPEEMIPDLAHAGWRGGPPLTITSHPGIQDSVRSRSKKTDVLDRRCRAVEHVGLLADGPPGVAGLSFIKSANDSLSEFLRISPRKASEFPDLKQGSGISESM
jgi:hypothetical protein